MTIIIDLAPCPFCGDKMPQLRDAGLSIFSKPQVEVRCSFCTAVGPAAQSRVHAANLWNRRVLPEKENRYAISSD